MCPSQAKSMWSKSELARQTCSERLDRPFLLLYEHMKHWCTKVREEGTVTGCKACRTMKPCLIAVVSMWIFGYLFSLQKHVWDNCARQHLLTADHAIKIWKTAMFDHCPGHDLWRENITVQHHHTTWPWVGGVVMLTNPNVNYAHSFSHILHK